MTIYSGFFPLKMVIFYSYVSLPEGNMDPINIPPINVSINIAAPWIRHGI